MTTERIGEVAGEVWNLLAETEAGLTLSQIKKKIDGTGDEVVAAVGWLAREDKLSFEAQARKTLIALCNASVA